MALQTKTITANGSKGHHKFTLTVNEDSTSVANNTSSISWSFKLSPIGKWNWSYDNTVPVTYTVTINGTSYSGNIMKYDGVSTVTVKSGTNTIAHNTDGTKTISYSFSVSSLDLSFLTGSASASGSMALTSIPRKATITAAPDFTDEGNPTITYSNPAGSAVTSLQACISLTGANDDVLYRDISKTGSSYTFNLTDAERKTLRKAVISGNTVSVKFFVRTIIGDTTYHSSVTKTLTLVNYMPTLAPVAKDIGDVTTKLTGDSNKIIKYFNYISIATGAAARKEATISSQSVSCGGKSITTATGALQNVESAEFNFSVTDNRGNTTTQTVKKTLIEYIKLTCNLSATIALEGETTSKLSFTISGKYFNGSFGAVINTLTVQYRYKQDDGNYSDWVNVAATASNNTYTATGSISNLPYESSYTIQARAIDKIYTSGLDSVEKTVKTIPVFDWSGEDFNFNVPVTIKGSSITEEVLYNGSSVADVVTLAADASNFRYIEIYYVDNNGLGNGFARIYNPNGKEVHLSLIESTAAPSAYIRHTNYTISGTTITPEIATAGYLFYDTKGAWNSSSNVNYLRIRRVVGYR